MVAARGVNHCRISEQPIAIVDFETTGLTPGHDRVVEVSVVRLEPGKSPQLVLDTLINPGRSVSATEIHGITDDDVAEAPSFRDVAGKLVEVLSGCVVAAYNVYFDMRFLNFELRNIGVDHEPPHFCLMYLRPMLGLGSRCKLEEACRQHGIEHDVCHMAANDAMVCGKLLSNYLAEIRKRDIATYGDLARLKRYKFLSSFDNDPFPGRDVFKLPGCERLRSRSERIAKTTVDPTRRALVGYWDALRTVVADLEITDEELEYIVKERARLGLKVEQIRALHARAFAGAISQFTDDRWLDDREVRSLRRLRECLSRLGWAPGD